MAVEDSRSALGMMVETEMKEFEKSQVTSYKMCVYSFIYRQPKVNENHVSHREGGVKIYFQVS